MNISYHNENDGACCAVLRRQFPEAVIDDRSIEDVKAHELKDYRQCHFFAGIGGFCLGFRNAGVPASLNVWTGGFPCQDVSVAGKRKGLAGKRSGLYFEFHRLITTNFPEWVVLENVPGLLSSNDGKDFAIVIGGLTGVVPEVPAQGWGNAGFARGPIYNIAYRILDAQFFGVAQRRRRVFIVGNPGAGCAAQVLFESESGERDTPPRREAGTITPPLTGTGVGAGRTGNERNEIAFCIPASARGTGDGHGNGWNSNYVVGANNFGEREVSTALSARNERIDGDTETFVISRPLAHSSTSNHMDESQQTFVVATLNSGGNDGGFRTEPGEHLIAFDYQAQGSERTYIHRKNSKAQMIAGRPDAIAGNMGVRRLTPLECERLQGFPDGWTAGQSDSVRYRQLGNAVCVNVSRWLGERIMMVE